MSFSAQIWAREQIRELEPALKPCARFVLLTLADQVRDKHGRWTWIGQEALAKETRYCERAIREAIRELEQRQLVKCWPRFRAKGHWGRKGQLSHVIELFGPAFCDLSAAANLPGCPGYVVDPDQPAEDDTTNRQRGPTNRQSPDRRTHDQPADVSPEPLREPTRTEPPSEPATRAPARARSRSETAQNSNGPPRPLAAILGDHGFRPGAEACPRNEEPTS